MDNWSNVELFRMQYGELPKNDDERKIDYEKAFAVAAEKVELGEVDTFNAASMLRAAGSICKDVGFDSRYLDKNEPACFVCGIASTVRVWIDGEGAKFNSYWCNQCCKEVFQSARRGDKLD